MLRVKQGSDSLSKVKRLKDTSQKKLRGKALRFKKLIVCFVGVASHGPVHGGKPNGPIHDHKPMRRKL
jgi:hypothetical protein